MRTTLRQIALRLVAAVCGAGLLALFLHGQPRLLLGWAYERVGVTVLALAPLTLWALWTALRPGRSADLTLAYIGTTAQRVGLLGTVIGIVAATMQIGSRLSDGAAGAVTSALPAVGQALVSTAIGFCIAILCDFFRYLGERGTPAAPEEGAV